MAKKVFYVIMSILVIGILIIASLFLINFIDVKADKQEKVETYCYDIPDSFVTNLLDSQRFIKVKVSIQVTDNDLLREIDDQSAKVKDNIIYILRNKKEEDFNKSDIQLTLKNEILSRLKEVFETDKITDIYFSEFVLQ
ncbi:MAG: flagellar basal body-associated FliL family protein [Clostridia bacterium]|nr:flagellar basal body-associated FliL family protein [Clostridia bacterium]